MKCERTPISPDTEETQTGKILASLTQFPLNTKIKLTTIAEIAGRRKSGKHIYPADIRNVIDHKADCASIEGDLLIIYGDPRDDEIPSKTITPPRTCSVCYYTRSGTSGCSILFDFYRQLGSRTLDTKPGVT